MSNLTHYFRVKLSYASVFLWAKTRPKVSILVIRYFNVNVDCLKVQTIVKRIARNL